MADIIIAGGGPIGAMLALALSRFGVAALLVSRRDAAVGERPIALSYGSRLLLEREGAWPAASPTAIMQIHVSQRGGFGRTLIQAGDVGLPALGYVAPYTGILSWLATASAMTERVEGRVAGWTSAENGVVVRIAAESGVEMTERARLLVLADGSHSGPGESGRDYGQCAIVAEVQTERPHGNVAWERFTPEGPLALLPFLDRYALVWSAKATTAGDLMAMPEPDFLARLGVTFGRRLGRFLCARGRASFPLALRHRDPTPEPHVVLVGNAAQTLHPVAGQGMNLGLRDACDLAELVTTTHADDLGSNDFLRRYAVRRRLDRGGGIRFTDALVRLFSNAVPLFSIARGTGLATLDLIPAARRFVARRMIYGARALP